MKFDSVGPDYWLRKPPPQPDYEPPTEQPAKPAGFFNGETPMTAFFEIFKSLLTFNWMSGWRTYAVMFVVGFGWVMETFLGVDIPGLVINNETLLVALGLGAAANHKK